MEIYPLWITCSVWPPLHLATSSTQTVMLKNDVFWDVAPYISCVNRHFGRRPYSPPKRWFTQDLSNVTFQKTAFFIVTAVKTSNLTCDVDCLMAHILSYLVAGLNDECSQFHYCLWLFKISFPYGIPKQSSHMGLNQDYSVANSIHMRNDQEISLRWLELKVSCWKSKTIFAVCGLAPPCMNHLVCNGKSAARRWGTQVLCNMLNTWRTGYLNI
jgi:hypothetical protein